MVAPRFAQDLGADLRRVRILGRLRVARERGAAPDRSEIAGVGRQPEVADNARHVFGDVREEGVEIDRDDAAGEPCDGLVLAVRFREPAHRRQLADRHRVQGV